MGVGHRKFYGQTTSFEKKRVKWIGRILSFLTIPFTDGLAALGPIIFVTKQLDRNSFLIFNKRNCMQCMDLGTSAVTRFRFIILLWIHHIVVSVCLTNRLWDRIAAGKLFSNLFGALILIKSKHNPIVVHILKLNNVKICGPRILFYSFCPPAWAHEFWNNRHWLQLYFSYSAHLPSLKYEKFYCFGHKSFMERPIAQKSGKPGWLEVAACKREHLDVFIFT